MRYNLLINICLVLSLPAFNGMAQQRMEFNHIGGNEGLSDDIVQDIVQDQNGFIWMATNDGLNRYDGYSMTYFRYDPSNSRGLTSNVLTSLLIDQHEKMWIGSTDGGLIMYDPINNKFKSFLNNPQDPTSINAGSIEDIAEDNEGNIWINIRGKGISRLVKGKDLSKFVHYNTPNMGPQYIPILKSNQCLNIVKAKSGGIWVTSREGIQRLEAGKEKTDNLPFWGDYAKMHANEIIEVNDSTVWIIYQDGSIIHGMIRFDDNTGISKLEVIKQFSENKFEKETSYCIDKHGLPWLSCGDLLMKLDPNGITKYQYGKLPLNNLPPNRILTTFVDRANVLWLGTHNSGVYNYYIDKPYSYNFQDLNIEKKDQNRIFFQNAVHSVCTDKFGALWIGTEGGGIMRIRDGVNEFLSSKNNRKAQYKFFDANDHDSYWLPDNNIYNLFSDSKGRIWIGNIRGITQITLKTSYNNDRPLTSSDIRVKQFNLNPEPDFYGLGAVLVIKEDIYGTIWIAPWDGGLLRYIEDEDRFDRFYHNPAELGSLSHNIVRTIIFKPNGEAWIGTGGGGIDKMIFPEGPNGPPYFVNFKYNPNDASSLSHNNILNLAEDYDGNIWIGTFGGGLNKMIKAKNPSGDITFKRFTIEDNLPNNTIKGILFDKNNNLWATTNRELFRMNIESEEVTLKFDISRFNLEYFKVNSSYLFDNGYMMWGGKNGVALFTPDTYTRDSIPLNVTLTNFLVDNLPYAPGSKIDGLESPEKTIQYCDNIKLPHNRNTIEIEFAGIFTPNPKGISYKYYLEGYDDSSQITNSRSVRYTKIPHGEYKFHVQASSDGLIWTGKDKVLQLTIAPPIWLTVYAFIIYGLLVFIIGFFAYRIITTRIKLKSQIKIEHIKQKEVEKAHNLKLQYFTNISHEIRTPLSLITSPIDKLVSDPEMTPYQTKLLGIIQRNSTRLQNLINQLLDFRKMESGVLPLTIVKADIIPFIYDVFKAFENIADNRQINYRFSCKETKLESYFDVDKIEKILFNLLSNAFKFTPPNGTIILTLHRKKIQSRYKSTKPSELLIIEVKDTGSGISEEDQKKIFQPFYQTTDKQKGKTIGTGIGLAYTYNLVKMHKGHISLSSQPGEGTIFTISFPLDQQVYIDHKIEEKNITSKSEFLKDQIKGFKDTAFEPDGKILEEKNTQHEHTLLIVEDNKDLLYFLKNEFLNHYNVITATNGAIGIEISKKHLPDIIITDVMMPEMDGVEMCRILKTSVDTCHIPIIMLTAKTGVEAEEEGLETGADVYQKKPFKIELLKLSVKNLLQTKEKLYKQFGRKSDAIVFKKAAVKEDQALITRVTEVIKLNLDRSNFDVDELRKEVGMSRSALYKKLKHLTGMSTTEFIRYIKLNEAVQLFKQDKYSISEVTYMVGFSDAKYFRNCFRKLYGKTPSKYIEELKTAFE